MDNTDAQNKLLDVLDPNSDYSMDDFNAEFNNPNTTIDNLSNYKIPLKFVNKSVNKENTSGKNQNPEFAKAGDSGFDVRANVSETIVLMPTRLSITKSEIKTEYGLKSIITDVELMHGETKVIPTGLFFEIPENYEIQVRSRSGLTAKAQVVVLNAPGTVDCFSEDMMILTIDGDKMVTDLNIGDTIISYNVENSEFEKDVLTNIVDTNVQEVFKITTSKGFLEVTGKTPILTKDGYKLTKDLNSSDEILIE